MIIGFGLWTFTPEGGEANSVALAFSMRESSTNEKQRNIYQEAIRDAYDDYVASQQH